MDATAILQKRLDYLRAWNAHEGINPARLVEDEAEAVALEQAIAILSSWPRWQPLIEAAGKVDKKACLHFLQGTEGKVFVEVKEGGPDSDTYIRHWPKSEIETLLAALPEAPDA